jgi:putative acetyltransferase
MARLEVRREDPAQPEIRALIGELDRYLIGLYDPEENHLLDIETLRQPDIHFFVGRVDGVALACGALRVHSAELGEVKRMYVAPRARGTGLGRRILLAIEEHACSLGLFELKLETGDRQPEALGLYRAQGFEPCGSFAGYPLGQTTVFLGKSLR